MPSKITYYAVSRVVSGSAAVGCFRLYTVRGTIEAVAGQPDPFPHIHPWKLFTDAAEWWEFKDSSKHGPFPAPSPAGVTNPREVPSLETDFDQLAARPGDRRGPLKLQNEPPEAEHEFKDDPNDLANTEGEDWTSTLAGLTDHGFPFVQRLALGYRGPGLASRQAGFLVPILGARAAEGVPGRSWEVVESKPESLLLELKKTETDPLKDVPIFLDIQLKTRPAPKLLLPVSGVAASEDGGLDSTSDWRRELAGTAGEAFDLLRYFSVQTPNYTLGSADLAQTRALAQAAALTRVNSGTSGASFNQFSHPGNIESSPYPLFVADLILREYCDSAPQRARLTQALAKVSAPKNSFVLEALAAAMQAHGNTGYGQGAELLFDDTKVPDPQTREVLFEALTGLASALGDDAILISAWYAIWMDIFRTGLTSDIDVLACLERLAGRKKEALPSGVALPSTEVLARIQEIFQQSGRGMSARSSDALAGRAWADITKFITEQEAVIKDVRELRAAALARGVASVYDKLLSAIPDTASLQWLAPWLAEAGDKRLSSLTAALRVWVRSEDKVAANPTPLTRAPMPLRFAIAELDYPGIPGQVEDAADIRGVLVFCRRYHGDAPNSPWKAINLGAVDARVKSHTDPIPVAGLAVNPIGGTLNNDLAVRSGEYIGLPIGVDLEENQQLEDAVTNPAYEGKSGPPVQLSWKQLVSASPSDYRDEWHTLPGLGYGWSYRFVQSPVFSDGLIHDDLMRLGAPLNAKDGIPLKHVRQEDVDNVNRRIDQAIAEAPAGTRFHQTRTYLRTVGIGPLRLYSSWGPGDRALPKAPVQRNLGDAFEPKFTIPKLPPGVAPLSSAAVRQRFSGKTPGELQTRNELNRLPILVLHPENPSFSFRIRPPAAGLDDWTYWLRRNLAGVWDPNQEWSELVSVAKSIVRHAALGRRSLFSREAVDWRWIPNAADLLDDMAASKALLRIQLLYAPALGFANTAPIEILIDFQPLVPGIASLQPFRQVSDSVSIRRETGATSLTSQAKIRARLDANRVLTVGPQEVWQISLLPLVAKDDRNFFAPTLWSTLFAPTEWNGTGLFPAKEASISLLVEAAHKSSFEIKKPGQTQREFDVEFDKILPAQTVVRGALTLLAEKSKGRRLQIFLNPEFEKPKANPAWINVHSLQVSIQTWYWNGIPPWGHNGTVKKLGQHPGLLLWTPSDGIDVENPNDNEQGFVEAEERAFATRLDPDALAVDATMDWIPLGSGDLGYTPGWTAIFTNPGPEERFPRFHRARILVRSRYYGLPGYREFEQAGAFKKDGRDQWKRLPTLAGQVEKLQPPRVKMVIPLFANPDRKRPGFLALTFDPLPSPFHTLTGRIATAKFRKLETGKMVEAAEAGPDPILDDGVEPSWADALMKEKPLLGRAIGLTFEREAQSPLFPNAAFLFDDLPSAIDTTRPDSEWFIKLSFRWERSANLGDPDPNVAACWDGYWAQRSEDFGPETAPWQVRVLAPFEHMDSPIGKVPLRDLQFTDLNGLKFSTNGKEIHITPATHKKYLATLFLTFSAIPDFLSDRPSFVPRAIYALDGPEPQLLGGFEKPTEEKGYGRRQGCFLRILVAPQGKTTDLGDAADRLFQKMPPTLGRFMEALFQDGNKDIDADAMLVHSSAVINSQT